MHDLYIGAQGVSVLGQCQAGIQAPAAAERGAVGGVEVEVVVGQTSGPTSSFKFGAGVGLAQGQALPAVGGVELE